MRRFKQLLPKEDVERILKKGKYAVWAVSGDNDYPYAVPVNYVYNGNCIYIHSATSGHKLDSIRRNPKCSLCIVDKDDIIPEEFTSYFRSVIVFGHCEFVETDKHKRDALLELCEKYSKDIDPTDEIDRLIAHTAIIKVNIDAVTGKEAIELTRMRKQMQ